MGALLEDYADNPAPEGTGATANLVNYVMDLVIRWRTYREANFQQKWAKYEAIYRGEWNDHLRTKVAERSKIITPVTTNAVDQSVSEIIEAIFGRGKWFEIDEDGKSDQEVQAAEVMRDSLTEDLERDGIKKAIIDCVYNGAKFGTGILKRIIDTKYEFVPADLSKEQARDYVCWEAVPPKHFVIDSSAVSVYEAHGCAHEKIMPRHAVVAKQASGEWMEGDVQSASGYGSADVLTGPTGQTYEKDPLDGVYITEYHGLVPRWMLEEATSPAQPQDPLDPIADTTPPGDQMSNQGGQFVHRDDDLVEAIVTIGNSTTLLKAVENPILNHDRGFIAYQHYAVPNSFWGMGVPEKAFNSQLALDAEIRARMDTLALVTYPTITADATRLPRNMDLSVVPGKVYRTNGRGSEIIEPLKFGNLDPVTFQHSSDLERYVQLATGASDPSTPVNTNRSTGPAGTASASSMQFGSYIKRAKLPMQAIDEGLLDPLVRKSLLAYMTIAPDKYPELFDYQVNSTLGIMAREFEQMQLTNLMALLEPNSPAHTLILKAIITNYSGPNRAALIAEIEKATQPNPQQQQMQNQMQQIGVQTAMAQLQKLQAEVKDLQARAGYTDSKIGTDKTKLHQKDTELHIQAAQTLVDQQRVRAQEHQTATNHGGNVLGTLAAMHGARMTHKAAMTGHAVKVATAKFQAEKAAKQANSKSDS